jgi:hypothetical protein
VFVGDVRGTDQYLRATWHPDDAVVVVSNWVGDVCVGATAVGLADASKLIQLLVSALQDMATRQVEAKAAAASAPSPAGADTILGHIRRRFRPELALVIHLRLGRSSPEEQADGQGG